MTTQEHPSIKLNALQFIQCGEECKQTTLYTIESHPTRIWQLILTETLEKSYHEEGLIATLTLYD